MMGTSAKKPDQNRYGDPEALSKPSQWASQENTGQTLAESLLPIALATSSASTLTVDTT